MTTEAQATPARHDDALPGLAAATLCEAFQRTAEEFADYVALREFGGDLEITWAEYRDRAARIAAGLAGLGVERGDTVAIMLTNRPEFHLVDMAALNLGAVPFSIYNTSSPEQIAYFFANAENRVLVTESAFAEQVRAADAPGLEHVVMLDGSDEDTTLADLEAADPGDVANAWRAVEPGDVATLIYTSGTTGPPKGVQLTHENLIADWRSTHAVLPMRPGGRVLSYLPCAHLADRFIAHYCGIVSGTQITTVANPAQAFAAVAESRPTSFSSVPRAWEKLHSALVAQGAEAAAGDPDAAAAVRASLGLDDVDWCASGAAPIAAEVLDFFAAIGLPISEVWGMSEIGCIGTANPLDAIRVGTVGKPIPGVEAKLAADGELLVRGPNVMIGYRNDPERTAEALDDEGWMHTGDIAEIDADGYVTIVDRKKELIINAAGKNMSPANIERAVKGASPLIGQACVVGDRRPYNVALLVLDPEVAQAFAAEHGIAGEDSKTLAADPQVQAAVARAVAEANDRLSRVEQIKRYELLGSEWLPDSDELTPTSKLKRRAIGEKYAAAIDALYAEQVSESERKGS